MINMNQKKRLFVDMDGTLSVFTPVDALEKLYQPGWFKNQKPQENVVNAVREIIRDCSDKIEVYILTSYLEDSKYAFDEKREWLSRYLPEIDDAHQIYVPCGAEKSDPDNWRWPSDIYDKNNPGPGEDSYMRGFFCKYGMTGNDFLLDDYTKNLVEWEPPGKGIKLLNGINHTRGTWQGNMVQRKNFGSDPYYHIEDKLYGIVCHGDKVRDIQVKPQEKEKMLLSRNAGR